MQKQIIKIFIIAVLVFIIGVFYVSLKTNSNYRTIKLICNKFFYLKLKKQIKLEVIAFDLDGVLINSIPNMKEA